MIDRDAPAVISTFNTMKLSNFVLVFGLSSGMLASAQSGSGSDWRASVSPYLWFPGAQGTVGAFNRDANISASAIDLLSHFRFGLMGEADTRWKRLVLPLDLAWVRLADDKAVPTVLGAMTADVKVSMLLLTPKIGVRLLDEPKIKCDFLTGVRYWHLGQDLNFSPSILNQDFSTSQNWVDPLVGGRIQSPLSSKIVAGVFGDVGGWGTGSQLEYQVGGLLGYKLKKATLQAGYRYLAVNYRGGGVRQPVFDAHLSGLVLGFTFDLK
jgi:hypothetical protein